MTLTCVPFVFQLRATQLLKIGAHQKGTLEEAINTIHEEEENHDEFPSPKTVEKGEEKEKEK